MGLLQNGYQIVRKSTNLIAKNLSLKTATAPESQNMEELIQQFFFSRSHLSMPGIGEFKRVNLPAATDFVNHQIIAPSSQVLFTNNAANEMDKQLVEFVAERLSLTETIATQKLEHYFGGLKEKIMNRDSLYFQNIGTLSKNELGILTFAKDSTLKKMFAPAPAVRVIREGIAHQMLVGEKETTTTMMAETLADHSERKKLAAWWWWVIGLVLLSILAILSYSGKLI
jgi:hypothetical protein